MSANTTCSGPINAAAENAGYMTTSEKYFTKIVGDGWAGLVLKLDLDIIRI